MTTDEEVKKWKSGEIREGRGSGNPAGAGPRFARRRTALSTTEHTEYTEGTATGAGAGEAGVWDVGSGAGVWG